MNAQQPCDWCGNPVPVNAVSPSECYCSAECCEQCWEASALAIEARRATTTKIGVVHESAGPKDNAQNMSGPSHE